MAQWWNWQTQETFSGSNSFQMIHIRYFELLILKIGDLYGKNEKFYSAGN